MKNQRNVTSSCAFMKAIYKMYTYIRPLCSLTENTDHFFTDAEIIYLKIKQTFLCRGLVVKKKYYLPTEIPRVKYNYTGRLLPIFVCLNLFEYIF